MLEKYFKAYAPDMPPNPGLYLSAFLDDVIDLYIFHGKGSGAKPLSAIQELQLLEVICSCFQDQPSDIVRCGVFYILFGISGQDIKDGKVRFLASELEELPWQSRKKTRSSCSGQIDFVLG